MRKDRTFSNKKLTRREFSKKYWGNGDAPYQYHTGSIDDGRDEREQFLFNNVRALWERMNIQMKQGDSGIPRIQVRIKNLENKISVLAVTNMLTGLVVVLLMKGHEK